MKHLGNFVALLILAVNALFTGLLLFPAYSPQDVYKRQDYSKPTLTKKDGSTFNAQRNNLSYIDIVAIYDIYGFPTGGGGPSVTSIK